MDYNKELEQLYREIEQDSIDRKLMLCEIRGAMIAWAELLESDHSEEINNYIASRLKAYSEKIYDSLQEAVKW